MRRNKARFHSALTGLITDVRFGSTRDFEGDITLSRAGKLPQFVDRSRRDFLLRFCQGAGATLIPSSLWGLALPNFGSIPTPPDDPAAEFYLHPRYRSERPLDAAVLKVQPGLDEFVSEKYADEIAAILGTWRAAMLGSVVGIEAVARSLARNFEGGSLRTAESRVVRSSVGIQVRQNKFADSAVLSREEFLRDWQLVYRDLSKIDVAEFQITWIDASGADGRPGTLKTRVRYEIVGSGAGFHREQRVGTWQLDWELSGSSEWRVRNWRGLDETQARAHSPIYLDVAAAVLGSNSSYAAQLLHGTDYWRTVLDGASGIDIYGHNGVSAADIDNDGFDDLYVCQPAGLPNRLYRNRGNGTFEDITEVSGLGILENTACALFADFDNDGRQDVIVVCTSGPRLFLNEGAGKFRLKPNAFQFANAPQGTFTGAAVADYDRDGWLDIYFCLYAYYQGTGQYKYPSPYHDAENGPPNFLMRNQRDGTFYDVTARSGLNKNNTRYSFCCGWGDYNRDGWPDLYVVNDFGRKNLYRNNGDGTFTDVAPQAGVEDVGAGMSVGWLDSDNDGHEDLYVANMWTAAGVRVSMQDVFKNDSPQAVRALYQKHAMGNSLFRNRGETFDDVTDSSGVGIGRWSWSSDAFDFDHDGFPDLYITNGMVSGPSPTDLNSFFWRQVVANSPDEAGASHGYELGWNAINELIRSDGTWSGYERNVLYANNGDGTFSDISAVAGLDFIEDGRAFALADFDHDGRLEIFLKNRNGPQLRVLKNVVEDLPSSISFRLQGTKSNRDAIGATVTIETSAGKQMRMLQAGSAFLSQHSKDVFFGLGNAKGAVRASIHWPSGLVQQLQNLPVDQRIWVEEGAEPTGMEPFQRAATRDFRPFESRQEREQLPTPIETWLLEPVPAPEFSLPDASGRIQTLAALRGKALLLNFCTAKSADCQKDLEAFEKNHLDWPGLQVLAINVDDTVTVSAHESGAQKVDADQWLRERKFSFPILRGSGDIAAIYNILYRQVFDRHRDLSLPTSFLIDGEGRIVKIYQGRIVPEQVEQDFKHIPRSDAERLERALPFPSANHTLASGRNYLSLGALFFQRGYLDQSEVAFQQALRGDPSSAEALYGIGSVYLNQKRDSAAREMFERCVKLEANYPDTLPDAWNNLGVIATHENRIADAVECFQKGLKLNPRHLLSLTNLGNAYRVEKRWDEAREVLDRALDGAPDDPEANYSLGMVFAQTNETDKAYAHLQQALKARPVYPEALNNLGILLIVTHRQDEAVANFQRCIQVAPTFDQAYLNLARVYAQNGEREKARAVLLDLLRQHPDHQQAKQMLEQLQ